MSRNHLSIVLGILLALAAVPAAAQSLEDLRAQQRFARGRLNDYARKADELQLTLKDPNLPDNAQAERRLHNDKLEEQRLKLFELKKGIHFKLRDLTQDLRDKAIKLSIDGMGTPGRLSTRELELTEMIKHQFTLQRQADEVKAEIEQLVATTEPAKANPRLAELGQRKDLLARQLQQVSDQINQDKADLGDMTYALRQYLLNVEEDQATRQKLREVSDKLEDITAQQLSKTTPAATQNKELINKQLATLTEMQNECRARLKDLDTQIEKIHQSQAAATFPGTVDVFLSPAELSSNKPAIPAAHLDKTLEINGKRLVRLISDTTAWTFDPTQITAVRATANK